MTYLIPTAAVVLVLLILYRRKKLKRVVFLSLLLMTAAGGVLLAKEGGGRTRIGELDREELETEGGMEMEVETDSGSSFTVEVTPPAKEYSDEEIQKLFDETEQRIDATMPGKNASLERVEWNLEMRRSYDDLPVNIQWYTDHPELVDFDGQLHTGIPEKGCQVRLTAELELQKQVRSVERDVRVYPSREEETIREEILEEAGRLNQEESDESSYRLPSEVQGKQLRWYQSSSSRGKTFLVLALVGSLLGVWSQKENEMRRRARRAQQLEEDYPELVSRLQLYLGAGMSMRAIFGRIAKEYQKKLRAGEPQRVAYEEISRCAWRMENGITEAEAYDEFGSRCGIPCYRALALLLVQNLKKGGDGLLPILEREVQTAFETKKRKARADGERITVKLLLPLFMELGVVMLLILIPALFQF
jgi:tight adherence protein C